MTELRAPRPRRQKANVGAGGIIDVAERLFAQQGFDAVSLRQIAIEAGLSNPFSVQYHFGDRDGLVRAIYASRLPRIDADRAELLHKLEQSGAEIGVAQLVHCICRPFIDEHRAFARFFARVMRSDEQRSIRAEFDHLAPETHRMYERIVTLLPQIPRAVLDFRMTAANLIILDITGTPDLIASHTLADLGIEERYDIGLAAAIGCMHAPLHAI